MRKVYPQKRTFGSYIFAFIIIPIVLAGCAKEETSTALDDEIASLNLEALPTVQYPVNNINTSAKIALGRLLFWDPILSGHKDVACATCHHPDFAYGDGLDLPIGVNGTGLGPNRTENTGGLQLNNPIERVPRNSPSILNTAFNGCTDGSNYLPELAPMFWDVRMFGLEAQCQGPVGSRSEMRGEMFEDDSHLEGLIARVAAIPEYASWFSTAFPESAKPVSIENFAKALGSFERTIVSVNSPYDQYVKGERSALTDQQKKGLVLFFGKANCGSCHSGPMFSDFNFHALGVPEHPAHPDGPDKGKDDLYKFRTPTLRNAEITGPYMHSGMLGSLRKVVEFMNDGITKNDNVMSGMLDQEMKPLGLSADEMDAIVAFLKSLTDTNFDRTIPQTVPSGLPVGGNIH